jgi:hypothetical protein
MPCFPQSNCSRRMLSLLVICVLVVTLSSCNSGPARIEQPHINASAAGDQAMEMYDTNGDGFVAGDELAKAPGLNAARATIDTDGDGRISADEVADRVLAWQEERAGLTNLRCVVRMNGRPLEGAEVVFEPEAFLGGEIETARGSVGARGSASISIPKAERPTPDTPPGLRLGLYKIRVSKIVGGRETVPARYNSETTLGQEVSLSTQASVRNGVELDLKSGSTVR